MSRCGELVDGLWEADDDEAARRGGGGQSEMSRSSSVCEMSDKGCSLVSLDSEPRVKDGERERKLTRDVVRLALAHARPILFHLFIPNCS